MKNKIILIVLVAICGLFSTCLHAQFWNNAGNISTNLGARIIGSTTPSLTNDSLYIMTRDTTRITIESTGGKVWFAKAVGIGTAKMGQGYMLSVNGKARAREVVVNLDTWSDFVFDDNYKMPSLFELEEIIKRDHHLPGVPSAQEVKDNGVSLGEMNKILLQKVEELTLYITEMNKRITLLEEQKQTK